MSVMAEKKKVMAPNVSPNKVAMSRALGAAFLSHQVEQLEKSVSSSHAARDGAVSGNWRSKRFGGPQGGYPGSPRIVVGPTVANAAPPSKGPAWSGRGRGREVSPAKTRQYPAADEFPPVTASVATPTSKHQAVPRDGARGDVGLQQLVNGTGGRRRSSDADRDGKDGDVVVVDASVLVNALYQLKRWCRNGREEIVIVPLEALNTLDLLKKGTSALAQRARAASRILEAQVGSNPRIRVQQDDAFVLWDKIKFEEFATDLGNVGTSPDSKASTGASAKASPEWVRRTICCARWEIENAATATLASKPGNQLHRRRASDVETADHHTAKPEDADKSQAKVVLAVCSMPELSPRMLALKLADQASVETPMTPVPLPAPTLPHVSKFEPRVSGTLVAHWAAKAGIRIMDVDPTMPGIRHDDAVPAGGAAASISGEGADGKGHFLHPHHHGHHRHHGGRGRRSSVHSDAGRSPSGGAPLVERPPAVMAMMEMVSQPRKVVRVLARGEKLDPDP